MNSIIEWTHRSTISLISLSLDLVCRLGVCTMPVLDNMYTFVIKLANNTELGKFVSMACRVKFRVMCLVKVRMAWVATVGVTFLVKVTVNHRKCS